MSKRPDRSDGGYGPPKHSSDADSDYWHPEPSSGRPPQHRRYLIPTSIIAILVIALGIYFVPGLIDGSNNNGSIPAPPVSSPTASPAAGDAEPAITHSLGTLPSASPTNPVTGRLATPATVTSQPSTPKATESESGIASLYPSSSPDWRTPGTDPWVPATNPPGLTAKAAFAVDISSNRELFAFNADVPLPPASTTKIITALVVIDHAKLDQVVTIEPGDQVDPKVYSHMGIEAGDQLTVGQLLQGLLIPSGDDAAKALARAIGASLPGSSGENPTARFVAAMNAEAASLGMKNSHFTNPDGLDANGLTVSARDLAIAAAALLKNPTLANIVDTAVVKIEVQGPNPRTLTLYNTNEMLTKSNVIGVKTGTTGNAGECLVMAENVRGSILMTVVLGSSQRYTDDQAILDYLDANYQWVRFGDDGDFPKLQAELHQAGLTFGTTEALVLPNGYASNFTYDEKIDANHGSDPKQSAGTVTFFVGKQPIVSLPVYPTNQ